MAGELRSLEELLTSRIGLDPVSVGSQLILRAVRQRMTDLGLDDLGAYERRVQAVGAGAAGADRGGRGLGELVLPRRAPFRVAPRVRSRAAG